MNPLWDANWKQYLCGEWDRLCRVLTLAPQSLLCPVPGCSPDGTLPVLLLFRSTKCKSHFCLNTRFSWGSPAYQRQYGNFYKLCPGVGQTCPCSPHFTMWCWVTAISHPPNVCVLLVLCLSRMGSRNACYNWGVFAYTRAKNEHRAFLVHWYLFMRCHVLARCIPAPRLCGGLGLNWLFWSQSSSSCWCTGTSHWAFSLTPICKRFMGIYYIDLTQYLGIYYLLENVNKKQVLLMHFNPWSNFWIEGMNY